MLSSSSRTIAMYLNSQFCIYYIGFDAFPSCMSHSCGHFYSKKYVKVLKLHHFVVPATWYTKMYEIYRIFFSSLYLCMYQTSRVSKNCLIHG